MTTTHYDTLGVARAADLAVIKAAYRALSRTHHPDAGGDPERFLELREAYEVLSDPDKRAAYDAVLDAIDRRNQAATPPPRRDGPTAQRPHAPGPDRPTAGDQWVRDRRDEPVWAADAAAQAATERLQRRIDDTIGDDPNKAALFNELRSQGHSVDDAVKIVSDARRAAARARRIYIVAGAVLATLWGLMRLGAPAVLYAGPSPIAGHVTTLALVPWLAGAGAYGAYRATDHLDGPVLWFARRPLPYAGAAAGAVVGAAVTAEQILLNMVPALGVIVVCSLIGGAVGFVLHKRRATARADA